MNQDIIWTQEKWIQTRNTLILDFIDIEKNHLKQNGATDVSDLKIVNELFEKIKSRMGGIR